LESHRQEIDGITIHVGLALCCSSACISRTFQIPHKNLAVMRVVFGVVITPGMIPLPETGKSERDFRGFLRSFLINDGTQ